MKRFTPSETAAKSGFSLDTLRYYEKIGLLHGIGRTSGGKRVFTEADLGWLGLLRCLRDTGMPLAQISRYAVLARGGEQTLTERVALLEEHACRVEAQMRLLHSQYEHLREKIRSHRLAAAAA